MPAGANEKEIDLMVDVEPELPKVSVDPDRIAQVLDNLLNNAIRYSPASGQVLLTAKFYRRWRPINRSRQRAWHP